MTVTFDISDELYRQALETASAAHVPVGQVFASAFEERHLAFERLKARAARGRYEDFRAVMEKVPEGNVVEGDELGQSG